MYAKLATGVSFLISFFFFFNFFNKMWKVRIKLNASSLVQISNHMFFQENTVFIDTKKMGIIKKKVRKLEDQLGYESRR